MKFKFPITKTNVPPLTARLIILSMKLYELTNGEIVIVEASGEKR